MIFKEFEFKKATINIHAVSFSIYDSLRFLLSVAVSNCSQTIHDWQTNTGKFFFQFFNAETNVMQFWLKKVGPNDTVHIFRWWTRYNTIKICKFKIYLMCKSCTDLCSEGLSVFTWASEEKLFFACFLSDAWKTCKLKVHWVYAIDYIDLWGLHIRHAQMCVVFICFEGLYM